VNDEDRFEEEIRRIREALELLLESQRRQAEELEKIARLLRTYPKLTAITVTPQNQ